jgi:hypothetical protein
MNVDSCVKAVAKVLYDDLKAKIRAVLAARFGPAPTSGAMIDNIMQAVDEAIRQADLGAGALVIQVAGGGQAGQPAPQPNFGGVGLVAGYNPMGMQQGFQQNMGNQVAPAANSALVAANLRDVGIPGQTCQVLSNGMPMPQGCKCGFEAKSGGSTGFCTSAASKVGISGYWCCSKHMTRKSPGLGKGGKKSGPPSGQANVIAQSQVMGGQRTPVGVPAVFGTAPYAQQQIAGLMQQTPSFIGTNPLAGIGQTNNPNQSIQLMTSVAHNLQQIPGVVPVQHNQMNLPGMLNQQPAVSVGIGQQFPGLQGLPGYNMQAVQTKGVIEDPEDDASAESDSDDDGSQASNSGNGRPTLTFQNPAAMAAAMAAANIPAGGMFNPLNPGAGQQLPGVSISMPPPNMQFSQMVNPLAQMPQVQQQMPNPLAQMPQAHQGLPGSGMPGLPGLPGTGMAGLQGILQGLNQPAAANPLAQAAPQSLPGLPNASMPINSSLSALQAAMNAPIAATQPVSIVQPPQAAPTAESAPQTVVEPPK